MLHIQILACSALAVSVGMPAIQYSCLNSSRDYFCVVLDAVTFIV